MLTRLMLMALAGITSAQNQSVIREQEALLSSALKTGDRALLLQLTDAKLHVSLDCASGAKFLRTELYRENWVDNMSNLEWPPTAQRYPASA